MSFLEADWKPMPALRLCVRNLLKVEVTDLLLLITSVYSIVVMHFPLFRTLMNWTDALMEFTQLGFKGITSKADHITSLRLPSTFRSTDSVSIVFWFDCDANNRRGVFALLPRWWRRQMAIGWKLYFLKRGDDGSVCLFIYLFIR